MPSLTRSFCLLLALLTVGVGRVPAQPVGDDVWEQIQEAKGSLQSYYEDIAALPAEETSYQLLFEAWSLTQPLPYGRDGLPLISDRTLHPDEETWSRIERWVRSAGHDEVFELILQAGESKLDEDEVPRVGRIFGLPYGDAGLEEEYLIADFIASDDAVVQLGGEAFAYMAALEDLRQLVFAEAYRRAESGELYEACELLVAWVRVGRQIADRRFFGEKVYGIGTMIESTRIMRNILYRHRGDMTVDEHRDIVDSLGALLLERIRFPEADYWALLSIIGDTFVRRGGPKDEVFIETFARMQSLSAPLTRFQVRQHWQQVEGQHAGYFETVDELKKVWGDWEFRWNIEDPYDAAVQGSTYFDRLSPSARRSFETIVVTMGPLDMLEEIRQDLQVAIGGTRVSLGVLGYEVKHRDLPANIDGIAPIHIPTIPTDPFDDREQRTKRRLQYFVPVRDYPPVAPREVPRPYAVQLHSRISGAAPVIEFNDAGRYDEFLVYSKGKDLRNDFLHEDDADTGDIMIWPPLEELLRSKGLWP
ncbi:MAG: hypothetical protein ACF8NJ_05890 [Phycisphaerales bacterium JB038]